MSTGQIKRYDYVGNDHDGIAPSNNGEFVKYDDHAKRVEELELALLYYAGLIVVNDKGQIRVVK